MRQSFAFACIAFGPVFLCGMKCVWPCSEINLTRGDYNVASRSADLPFNIETLIVLSPRGVQRTSRNAPDGDTPLSWTAAYGSVGFFLTGPLMCGDGVNEAGLSGAMLECDGSEYPAISSNRALSITYWLQYYLDTCQTVEEAIAAARDIKMYSVTSDLPFPFPEHLILHDQTGDSAVMEYDELGDLNIYRQDTSGSGPQYIYNGVLTNEPFYPEQIANLNNYKPWGGSEDLPGGDEPEARFVRGSWCLKQMYTPASSQEAIAYAFNYIQYVIEPVIQGGEDTWPTFWTTIRDMDNLVYYFNTFNKPGLREIRFSELDFTAGQSLKMQGIDDSDEGDVSENFVAAELCSDGTISYKDLSINPHNLVPGSSCDYTVYLGETICRCFDLYVLAQTPLGIYTLYPSGLLKKGIHKTLKNVPGFNAPYTNTFAVIPPVPQLLSGREVTFYIAVVEAGRIPPCRSLSGLTERTPYVISMDKEPMTVK